MEDALVIFVLVSMVHFAVFGYYAAYVIDTKAKFSAMGKLERFVFIMALPEIITFSMMERASEKTVNWILNK